MTSISRLAAQLVRAIPLGLVAFERQALARILSATDGGIRGRFAPLLAGGRRPRYAVPANRKAHVRVAFGVMDLNGQTLRAGDGARLAAELHFGNARGTGVLLFDMA